MGITKKKTNNTKMAEKQRQLRAAELRNEDKAALEKRLVEFRQELATLQVAKVTSGGPSKLGKIHSVRKNIAKVLIVINQARKAELQKFYRGKNIRPVDLKPRKIRALRRRLNKHEESLKNLKTVRREQKSAKKVYALKA